MTITKSIVFRFKEKAIFLIPMETRILEEPIAPLDGRSLGLVGGDQRAGRERGVVDIVGGQDEEALFAEGRRDLLRVFPKRGRDPNSLKRGFGPLLGPSL